MSTLRKRIIIVGVMLACVNLFAVQVEGSGDPWGVKGTQSVNSNYGYLGHTYYGVFGSNFSGTSGALGTTAYGVYGRDASGDNYGYIGSSNYGAYAIHFSNNYAYLASSNYGAYGRYSSGNYGYLGSSSCGAYGFHSSNNYGYLGSDSYGAYGTHSSGNYGYLGSSGYGAYGRNANGNYAYLGGSTRGICSYAATTSAQGGYFSHTSGSAVTLAGNLWGAYIRGPVNASAHIATSGTGIEATGSEWAGDFTGDVNISGDLYVSGDKDNIIKLDDGTWVTMSATEAPYPEYTISGRTTLTNGTARIEFEEPYPEVISSQIPIKVIVTPEGSWSGIYVKDVTVNGFTAVSEVGDRNATFSWMAIARVKGKEQRTDYNAVTAKMLRLEASQRELGINSQAPGATVDAEEPLAQTREETRPELRLSVPELNSIGDVLVNYELPSEANVTLSVYDPSGRLVKTLVSEQRNAGDHSIVWDSTDESGRTVSGGVYYLRLEDGESLQTAKVTIIK